MELLDEIENLLKRIPTDFGGGAPLEKAFLMSYLAAKRRPETYVEIGVYRGRSFFPVAIAMKQHGGKAFGIDPYSKAHVHENDIAPAYATMLQSWIVNTDFDLIHRELVDLVQDLKLEATVEILRLPSEQAATHFQNDGIPIGMLHVDGNHDTRFVMRDVELYLPLVTPDGIVVMDDIDWESVKPAYEKVKERMTVLFEAPSYSVLINRPDGADLDLLKQGLALIHEALSLRQKKNLTKTSDCGFQARTASAPPDHPKVSVLMITYNQERYISTAIKSILSQETNFPFEVVVADDCSTDQTGAFCREYQQKHPGLIRLIRREKNLGAVPNFLEAFKVCHGEYVAFLEGDDYWTAPDKLQKQVEFLDSHKDFVICCHNVIAVDENGVAQKVLLRNVPETTTVKDLCRGDYIATASCVVRNHLLEDMPEWLYSLPGCDWALDILHAEKGKIRFLPESMAAYRIHAEGIWSGRTKEDNLQTTLQVAQIINRRLEYRHAKDFQVYEQLIRREIKMLAGQAANEATNEAVVSSQDALIREYETAMYELDKTRNQHQASKRELRALKRAHRELKRQHKQDKRIIAAAESWQKRSWLTRALHRWRPQFERNPESRQAFAPVSQKKNDGSGASAAADLSPPSARRASLIILDDLFPHPLSAFRFEEYTRYLESIPDMMVYSTAGAFGCLREKRTLEEIVAQAEERNPLLKGRVSQFDPDMPLNAILAYVVFLGNIAYFLDRLEMDKIPFVFTLYPGGSFELNDPAKDRVMRRVFSSAWFRKVIVTQNITREYLLEHDFCAPEQIVYIQGVVTPSEHLRRDLSRRMYHGFGKARLDICFVAHKYSTDGADKGYDVFLEVARKLSSRHTNIFFHVVGGFDETVIDVSDLGSRITFYGSHEPSWFKTFYLDKDIILSPNIPFRLAPGAFDGFPTGCCTDAALHAVAMFCTDLLGLNENFTNGQDIVLIPYNVERITEIIEHYHQNPAELRDIALKGCTTSRHLCSYDYQMVPRLRLLKELIQEESHA